MRTEPAEQIRKHLDRREWDSVVAVLEEHWSALTQDRRELLGEVLNALPPYIFAAHPRLVAAKDYANFLPASGEIRPVRFQHTTAPEGGLLDVLAGLTSKSAAARSVGRFQDGVAAANDVRAVLSEIPDAALAPIRPVLPDLRLQWSLSLELGGQLQDASVSYEKTYDEALHAQNSRIAVEAAGSLAFNSSIAGDRTRAERWLARQPSMDRSQTDTVSGMGDLSRTLLAVAALDPTAARSALDSVPPEDIVPELWALRLYAETLVTTIDGDLQVQLARLTAAKGAHPQDLWRHGLNADVLALADAELRLAHGHPHSALTEISVDSADLKPHAHVLRAWAHLRRGNTRRAIMLVQRTPDRPPPARVSAERCAILAAANLHLGQYEAATSHFRSFMELIRAERLFSALLQFAPGELETLATTAHIALPREFTSAIRRRSPIKPSSNPRPALSPRERVILGYLVAGETNPQIARREHLSPNTIKTQTRAIYKKLGVANRDEALRAVVATPEILE